MRQLNLVFCILFFVISTHGQHTEAGAEAAALGGSFVAVESPLAIYHNVAATIYGEENNRAFWAGARNNYLVSQLNDFYIGALFTRNKSAFGLDMAFFGIEAYQRIDISAAYATKLNANWNVGARITYANDRISAEGVNRHLVLAHAGILGKLGNWRVAAASRGFLQSGWMGRIQEHEPSVLRIGGGYVFSQHTILTAEVYKIEFDRPDFRIGLSYAPIEGLKIMFGFATVRPSATFGVSVWRKNIQINLAAAWHQQLGISPVTDVLVQD